MNPRPRVAARDAVIRALSLVGQGTYKLGALDSDAVNAVFDCTSFCMRYCYGIPGHRPGYNTGWGSDWCTGTTSTVEHDLNSNSAIEDALHARDLFEVVVGRPEVGDILAYPTITITGASGGPWIGHAAICVDVTRARGNWDPMRPAFTLLDMVECHGPNGITPAIRRTNGAVFDRHSVTWPKPQHRSWLLRVKL